MPGANADGTRPANIERVEVYGLTGAPPTVTDADLVKRGTRVASLAVKAPRDPNDTVEPGEPQDDVEAATWYRKAADQGAPAAQFKLGTLYRQGRGVPQDYVEAHKWFKLAILHFSESDAANRGNAIKNCHLLVAKMTPAQIAEAQKLAHEWIPSNAHRLL